MPNLRTKGGGGGAGGAFRGVRAGGAHAGRLMISIHVVIMPIRSRRWQISDRCWVSRPFSSQ
eukprot:14526572-Alexandrium_andersonii.AAC.1